MFNKFALLFAGLMLTVSSVGCCCLGGYGYGAGYGARGCAPCNNSCPPAGGGYYPQTGAVYQGGYDASQTAFAPVGGLSQTAFSQQTYAPSQSAFMPSTTAALPPGAIQGAPIYLNAGVPANNLPMY